jgi:membrane protease YdiL (CAAX protease family)
MRTPITSNNTTSSPRTLRRWMREHPLFSFFFIAYAFSWITLTPFVLSEWDVLKVANITIRTLIFALHTFGPAMAAYIMIHVTEGNEGWLQLRRRIRQVRVGWKWYVFVLLGIPAVMLLGILVLPGSAQSFHGLPKYFLVRYPFLFILIFFGGGPLGEEIGWRGFALPRMQSRFGSLPATLLLGVLWTFWHLADFLTTAQKGGPGTDLFAFTHHLPVFLLQVMALAIIFSWVFNLTKGSLFIAILLHASYDTFGSSVQPLFPVPIVTSTDLPFAIGMAVLALLILILTRGQLGYKANQLQPVR